MMLINSDVEDFSCPECHKRFKSKQKTLYHIENKVCLRRRKRGKTFECGGCDKKYSTKFSLRRHLRNSPECRKLFSEARDDDDEDDDALDGDGDLDGDLEEDSDLEAEPIQGRVQTQTRAQVQTQTRAQTQVQAQAQVQVQAQESDIFFMDQENPNLRNRLADMSDRLENESIAAWKKRKFFPKKVAQARQNPVKQIELAPSIENTDTVMPIWAGLILERIDKIEQKTDNALVERKDVAAESKEGEKDEENETTREPKIDIVCLAKGDYIKKIIQLHDGDEEKAMNYIKNVGIATDFLEGDFRMIKRIYFDGKKKSQFPIRVKDFKRNKLEYLEENGEWILDIRGEIVGKRLCENIVSTLLIANTQFNEVIIAEKDEDRKELLLDLFQINKTQAHIMKLLERKTQGKLSKRVAEFINFCTEVHAETGSLDNVKKAYE